MDNKKYGVVTPASKAIPSIRNNDGVFEFQDNDGNWNPINGGGDSENDIKELSSVNLDNITSPGVYYGAANSYCTVSGLRDEISNELDCSGFGLIVYNMGLVISQKLICGDYNLTRIRMYGTWERWHNNNLSYSTITIAAYDSMNKYCADYICNGADDQVVINAAINTLPNTGGKIILLEGTYNIYSNISVNKPCITIEGMGDSTKLVRWYNNPYFTDGVICISSSGGCKIKDLQIDGMHSNYSSSYNNGVIMRTSSGNTIENLKIINEATGIKFYNDSNMNLITKNLIMNLSENGIYFDGANNNIVSYNRIKDAEYGIVIDWRSSYNKVSDNYVIRGTGSESDYTSTQQTIRIEKSTCVANDISNNYILGKNYTDNGTNSTFNNNRYSLES